MAQKNFIRRYLLKAGVMGRKGFQIGKTSESNPHALHVSFSIEKSTSETANSVSRSAPSISVVTVTTFPASTNAMCSVYPACSSITQSFVSSTFRFLHGLFKIPSYRSGNQMSLLQPGHIF